MVHHLFNAIDEDDILRTLPRGGIMCEGRVLKTEEIERVRHDANEWADSFLWKMLVKELKFQANRRMFVKSQTPDDMLAGKMLLFLTEVVDKRLQELGGRARQ